MNQEIPAVLPVRTAQSSKGNECGIGAECQCQLIACHSMMAEDGQWGWNDGGGYGNTVLGGVNSAITA